MLASTCRTHVDHIDSRAWIATIELGINTAENLASWS